MGCDHTFMAVTVSLTTKDENLYLRLEICSKCSAVRIVDHQIKEVENVDR